ncbi:MAG: UvrB/UvrC motif-containing protein [Acidimicrobiia bacterium]
MVRLIGTLEEEMSQAAEELNFEEAARLRDQIIELRSQYLSARKSKPGR